MLTKTRNLKLLDKLCNGSKIVIDLLKYRIQHKPIPLCVHIQITKRCNLRCIYCYADPENLTNTLDLEFTEYTKLVDELVCLGTRWIRFLGGEPLIRDDIGQMIDYAKAKGIITEMNTNGYFIKDKGNIIKNLDSLVISIDGTKKTNDLCRGKGSYDKAIEAIEIAKDLGMSVRLHGCLSEYHQIGDIDHIANLAVKYGTAFNFSAPSPVYFKDDQRMKGHPGQKQVGILHQRCVELKSQGYPLTNTNTSTEYVKKWPNPHRDVLTKDDFKKLAIPKGSYVACTAGKLYCTIDVDGHVYACASLWKYGLDYKQVGFKKAWEHLNNLDCLSCNYVANIELNLLLNLNLKTLYEVGSYVLGRTAKIGKKKLF
ncbi:MAG: radical SAM protein [Candidatus Omnitrophica bacterium]|nr:radical SAM protein [Candidatus Omnitrophota bacterium]